MQRSSAVEIRNVSMQSANQKRKRHFGMNVKTGLKALKLIAYAFVKHYKREN